MVTTFVSGKLLDGETIRLFWLDNTLSSDVKTKWNVDPEDRVTYARLLSELEGVSYFLDSLGQTEDYDQVRLLCNKYYSLYFKASPK